MRRSPPCVVELGHRVSSVHVCETRNPVRQNVLSALRGSWQGNAILHLLIADIFMRVLGFVEIRVSLAAPLGNYQGATQSK